MAGTRLSLFLTKLREDRGFSREELAEKSKLPSVLIEELEAGGSLEKVPLRTLHALFASLSLKSEEYVEFTSLLDNVVASSKKVV